MSLLKHQLRTILCLSALSGAFILGASADTAGAGRGGILPPPPPPPPPVSERRNDSKTPVSNLSTGQQSIGGDKDELRILGADNIEKATIGDQTDANPSGNDGKRSWESANNSFDRKVQQLPPRSLNSNIHLQVNQPWENTECALPQRQDPSHDPLQLHQPLPPWDQQAQPSYQRQQYREQQYYQQYQRPPPQQQRQQQFTSQQQQFQRGSPPRQYLPQQHLRQLTIYSRPSPVAPTSAAAAAAAAAKSSALRIFSMAKQKVQTGMDVVSEQLETAKVASSVSSLTSRIGSMGGSIGAGGNRGLEGPAERQGHRPGRAFTDPRRMGNAPGQRMRPGGTGQGPRSMTPPDMRNRRIPPPQMGPPSNRQSPKPKDSYAPPISQLYSLKQDDVIVTHDDNSDDEDGSTLKNECHDIDSPNQTVVDRNEDMDSDEEDEKDLDGLKVRSPQNKPTEKLQSPSTSEKPPLKMQQPGQPMRSQPPTKPQQLNGRRLPPSSNTPSWPNNGGSTWSSMSAQRMYTYDDDNDDSIGGRIKSVIGSVPIPKVSKMFRGSKTSNYDDGGWSDDEVGDDSSGGNSFFRRFIGSSNKNIQSPSIGTISTTSGSGPMSSRRLSSTKSSNAANIPPPVAALLENREALLSSTSASKCASIGRTQAVLDVVRFAFVVCAAREILPSFITALSVDVSDTTLPTGNVLKMAIVSTILSTLDGWAPLALIAAILISASDAAWIQPALRAASSEAASEVEANAAYSQLYLRLIAAIPVQKSFSSKVIEKTTKAQASRIASSARLHFFVMLSTIYILMSTVVVLRPAGDALLSAITSFARLPAWHSRPIEWANVWESVKFIGMDLAAKLRSLISTELDSLRLQPLRVGVVVSLFGALLLVSNLPSMEKGRTNGTTKDHLDEDEKEHSTTGIWSNMAASSASRLNLLSLPRGAEGALEKFSPETRSKLFRKKTKRRQDAFSYFRSLQPLLRQMMYSISAMLLLSIPLTIYLYVFAAAHGQGEDDGLSLSFKHITKTGWVSLFDLTLLLVFVHGLVRYAARYAIDATNAQQGSVMTTFIQRLAGTVAELQKISADTLSTADFQAILAASPVKGLAVSDLWAAHSTRKAWAVKGANIQCRNGEVVMIIGDDGSGKSRLLTAISEHIFIPPKSARTTTYVRGSINIAGVDLAKWDRAQLQRRVGVSLNDVRTVSDWASLMSGCSLEEILEPLPVTGGARIGTRERNAIGVAIKVRSLL